MASSMLQLSGVQLHGRLQDSIPSSQHRDNETNAVCPVQHIHPTQHGPGPTTMCYAFRFIVEPSMCFSVYWPLSSLNPGVTANGANHVLVLNLE